ncbi:butyrophilin-like protein 3 [Gracilinanus agilis]|uniref:butyrophilin-like protein 3 n=1 Tax=Gracilinanus agilis TaxID=191870 RepID=UPI001CFCF264|nr:butyrophilin-like protein 3 [Gracilinanus agilis]
MEVPQRDPKFRPPEPPANKDSKTWLEATVDPRRVAEPEPARGLSGIMGNSKSVFMNKFTEMCIISTLLFYFQASKTFEHHLLLMFVVSLLDLGSGHFQVIGPDKPIQALLGEDILFSCHVSPKMNLKNMEVRFFRNQFSSLLVLYKDGKETKESQMQEYQGRTQFVQDAITEGRVSLKLKNIILSDAGIYGCWFSSQTFYQEYTWELQVAALGSSPLITLEKYKMNGILLKCQSSGWFPKPKVQWKNHRGKHLYSDFKANTGDDGLFDIETSLAIKESSLGDISCSIYTWDLRKESKVKIADQFFRPSPWIYGFVIMFAIFLIVAASGFFLHIRQAKLKKKLEQRRKMEEKEWRYASKHAVEVTLDQETACPLLQISEDCKTVSYNDPSMVLNVPENKKIFQSPCVVASQSFYMEDCYWEVEVGEKNRWFLGVCLDSVKREEKKPKLSPANGYWVLGRWNQHEHFVNSPNRQMLTLQVYPKKIGIFLNYTYGQISFFNVTNKSHIYTFTGCDFKGKTLHPYFRPRSNDIQEHSCPLIICTMLPGTVRNDTSPSNNDG